MDDKEARLIGAAIEVFSRYGIRRATMGDIAEQAGVSRQTLYANFASKQDIMMAAIMQMAMSTMKTIETAWADAGSIGDKLDIYFEHAVVDYFDKIRAMPDANDLLTGTSGAGFEPLHAAEAAKVAALAAQFAPYERQLEAAGTTAADLADLVFHSSANFKYVAADKAHLRRLLASLKKAALSLVGDC
ncbi:MAG: helix-turn-helix domain-containing protein [Rhizobiaceae bacterium]